MTPLTDALDAPRRTLATDAGGEVSYYVDDTASGPPLVLLHSINAAPSALEVRPLFDHYRRQRPVLALELPGFGFSERADVDYSPTLYADTIRAFLAASCSEPADVVALSTTAEFAARAALSDEASMRSLVLISPTGMGYRQPPGEATRERLRKFFRIPVLSGGLYRVLTTRASIRYFLNLSFEGRAPAVLVDYAHATARRPGAEHAPFAFLSMRLFTPDALETLYQPLAVRTLVLYDRDPNIDFDRLPELQEANPLVSATRISPTRGMPHWERPAETFAAIDAFWAAAQ